MPLTAEIAQRMIGASQEKARELGVAISTAIVDAEGRLFAFARTEGTHWLSIDAAEAKAYTGALMRRDGAQLQQLPAGVLASVAAIQGRGLLAMPSVTVLREGGQVIAGIGCSAFGTDGATDQQDAECAQSARDAY